jgi:hypothetical protein
MLNTFPARSIALSYSTFNSPVACSGSTILIHAMVKPRENYKWKLEY